MAIAAKIPAIATTISSSVRVKPEESRLAFILPLPLAGGSLVAGAIQRQRAVAGLLAAGRDSGEDRRRRGRDHNNAAACRIMLADLGRNRHSKRIQVKCVAARIQQI